MGLNTQGGSTSNKVYLSIFAGNIILQYDKRKDLERNLSNLELDIEEILVRKKTKGVNEGKEVYYFIIKNGVTGFISNVEIRKVSWGEEVVIVTLTDADQDFQITLGEVAARISRDFIRRCSNIDVSKEYTLKVWDFEKDEAKEQKPNSGVSLYNNKEKMEYTLTRDNMPDAIQRKNGKWDFSAQEDMLYEHLEGFIKENFKEEITKEIKKSDKKLASKNKKQEEDDLPF